LLFALSTPPCMRIKPLCRRGRAATAAATPDRSPDRRCRWRR
jgi:hypothetical protein